MSGLATWLTTLYKRKKRKMPEAFIFKASSTSKTGDERIEYRNNISYNSKIPCIYNTFRTLRCLYKMFYCVLMCSVKLTKDWRKRISSKKFKI